MIFITLFCVDLSAYAVSTGQCGENVTYSFDSLTGTLTISGTGAMEDYKWYCSPFCSKNIERVIINEGITTIGRYIFENCKTLSTVTIPNTVTNIGSYAFVDCYSLDNVIIPDSVTNINSYAFYNCQSLKRINIPDSVAYLGQRAFQECTSLTDVIIGSGIKEIFDCTFADCSELTNIIIGESVESIDSLVFYQCHKLNSISIPSNVNFIHEKAFTECSGMKSIVVDEGNPIYDSRSNCNAIIETKTNNLIKGCEATVIPDGVISIGLNGWYRPFEKCTGLTGINIPESVESIGDEAFSRCTGLTSITIPKSVKYIDKDAFALCSSLTSIKVDSKNSYYDSRNNCNALIETANNILICGSNNTTIPNGIQEIYFNAFYGLTKLTNIVIPDSVTSIGAGAFRNCQGLKSITIPDSVTYLGDHAFMNCTSLTDVIVGAGVTSIKEDSFNGCKSITKIVIPDNVNNIELRAFRNCINLVSITIPKKVTCINGLTFDGCTNLSSVTIPLSVTNINERAFDNCSNLKDVYYKGTREEWELISIESYNTPLKNATIHCLNYYQNITSLQKGTQVFDVYDKNEIASSNVTDPAYLKLKGVVLAYGSNTKGFDESTAVTTDELVGKELRFKKDAYNDYIIPAYVINDQKYRDKITHNVYMQKSEMGNKPYVSTVFVQQLTKKNQPHSTYKEVQTESLTILENTNYNVIISADTKGAKNVTYYLSQDDVHQISNNTGIFLEQELYSAFDNNSKIYAYAVCDGITTKPVPLKLEKKQIKGALKTIMTDSTINIFGADSTNFTLSKNVPIIGGSSVSTDFIKCPVGVEVQGNRVRISVGFDIFSVSDKYENGVFKESEWKGFKDSCRSLNAATKKTNKSKKEFDKFLKQKGYKRGKESSKTWSMDFFGFIEGNIVNGDLVITDISGTLAAEFAYKLKAQFGPMGIPAFYAYVKAGAEASAEVSGARAVPDSNMPILFDVTVGIEPKVTGGAGIGLEGVVSGGAYAKATMPVSYAIAKKNLKLDLTGEIGIEGHFIVVSGKVPIFNGEVNLINHTFGTGTKKALKRSVASNGTEFTYDESEGTVDVVDREYINAQKWVAPASNIKRALKAKSNGVSGITTQTLEESVNESPQPQLAAFGDKAMLVWIDDDSSRDTYNRYKLVYSIYNGSTWTAPKAVDDCGTNDYAPSVISINDKVYIAYQNFKSTLTTVDDNTVAELLQNSEIKLAEYNEDNDTFENVRTITDNDTYDYQPSLTNAGGSPIVYWANCNSTNYSAGSVSIMKSDFSGNVSTVTSSKNYIYELSAIGNDVYYTMQSDTENDTDFDLNLYMNDTQITSNDGSDSATMPVSLETGTIDSRETLFYTDNSNVYYLDGNDVVTAIENEAGINGGLEIATVNDSVYAVWCESTDYGTEFYTSNYDGKLWSSPIPFNEYNGLVSELSMVEYNNSLLGAFNKTERAFSDEQYINGKSNLTVFKTGGFTDVAVSLSEFNESEFALNTENPFTVFVENLGTEDISSIDFEITDTLGYSNTVTKTVNLKSGESSVVELTYSPTEFANGTITVTANANGDNNSDNNTIEQSVGNADISVSDITLEQVTTNNIVKAIVKNKGKVSASNVSVSILSNDEEINVIEIGELLPDEAKEITFEISSELLEYDEDNYCSSITFEATTSTEESSQGDNSAAVSFENIARPHEHNFVNNLCETCGIQEYTYTLNDSDVATITGYNGNSADLTLPESIEGYTVKYIGSSAFAENTVLESVTVPSGYLLVNGSAFKNCTNLISITLPNTLTSMGGSIVNGTAYYNTEENWDNNILYIGKYAVASRTAISGDIEIKAGTRLICTSCFSSKTKITSVILPSSMRYIRNNAFNGCSKLKNVTINYKKCSIYDSETVFPTTTVLTGYHNSTTETYASKYSRTFDAIHEWDSENTETISPTCIDDGYTLTRCLYCDATEKSDFVDALGHEYSVIGSTNPTCDTEGYTEYKCTQCGETYYGDFITRLGHEWDEGVIIKDASCGNDGSIVYTCLRDASHTKTEKIPATGKHKLKAAVKEKLKAATYTATGSYDSVVYCSVCGAEISRTKITVPKLAKKANTLTVKAKKPTVKYSKLKKKNQTIALKKAMTVTKAQGTVTYKLSSAKKGKKNFKKYFKVAKNGNITVKKGLKKGAYKVKIKVTAAGNATYKSGSKALTVTIKVK